MTQAALRPLPGGTPDAFREGPRVNLRFIDWIWHVRGAVALPPEQTADEAFARLNPLFCTTGTTHAQAGSTLTFRKKDAAAQDKLSVFDGGVLRIEQGEQGPVLRYRLASRALLFCFLAPLLFLAFGQLTVALGKLEGPPTAEEVKKAEAKKLADAKKPAPQLNPIDKMLGAPAPEKPGKDDKDGGKDKKPSPTPAYVFAGLFAALYVIGRILEARLVKGLFRKALAGA